MQKTILTAKPEETLYMFLMRARETRFFGFIEFAGIHVNKKPRMTLQELAAQFIAQGQELDEPLKSDVDEPLRDCIDRVLNAGYTGVLEFSPIASPFLLRVNITKASTFHSVYAAMAKAQTSALAYYHTTKEFLITKQMTALSQSERTKRFSQMQAETSFLHEKTLQGLLHWLAEFCALANIPNDSIDEAQKVFTYGKIEYKLNSMGYLALTEAEYEADGRYDNFDPYIMERSPKEAMTWILSACLLFLAPDTTPQIPRLIFGSLQEFQEKFC